MQITTELINLNYEQINYLIDLVSVDIEQERRAYKEGYDPYEREYHESKGGYKSPTRKVNPTKKQSQDHNAKAMTQHAVSKQLYIISQYSIEPEAQMSPSTFSKPGSELEPGEDQDDEYSRDIEDLCDENGRPL